MSKSSISLGTGTNGKLVGATRRKSATIGAHLGLKPGKDLTRPVIKHLSSGPPSLLLILDNLETLWEPLECRKDIEEFLALLADMDHLAVVITMRGAERPVKDAARNIFLDIADDGHVMEEVDRVLLTDNMPLAIHLLAHLVETEGCSNTLSLWAEKKTSVVSEGFDQGSNLDLSIALSLASPRIASLPQSQDLLSLLAILPDGLSDMELLGSKLPIPDILRCKLALLQTTLAYTDEYKRLKALVPIREYMLQAQPPRDEFIRPVLSHFQQLLEFFAEYRGSRSGSAMNVIRNGLHAGHPDLKNSIYCTLHLNIFSLLTGRGTIPLLDQICDFLPRPCDHRVEVHFISELLYSCSHHPISNAETLIAQAFGHFKHFEDPDLQCKFYNCLAHYQIQQKHDDALSLAGSTSNSRRQRETFHSAAWIKWKLGDYPAVEQYANELLRSARIAVGNYKRTISLCNRASQSLALCGITGGMAIYGIRNSQAVVHNAKSEYVEARNIGVRILANSMAEVDLHMGAPQSDIQKNIDVAKSILNRVGQAGPALLCDVWQARLRLKEGDILRASKLFQETFAASWGKDSTNAAKCLEVLGDIGLWGEMELTPGWSTWATPFLVYSLKLKKSLQIHKALRCLGDVFLGQGDEVTAIGLWTTTLDGFTLMDIHRGRADYMLGLGNISKGHGDIQRAGELWKTARPLFERSSQVNQVKQVDERLDSMDCCAELPRSAVGVSS
ncbi:hypothetical protein DFH08DRAFT_1089862 [Mycena albidolilacea]|uniref:Uncharacterized protein n=1 Tax=Mycena albidolilacea TaxID=1033008 RepID=A0AAD6YZK5_9AGAR|nr:hypothetical protein DFH08DRAFT_1089862 [Mycena albidolilacea]